MLGRLYHAPHDAEPVGTATVGSSEAIMLATGAASGVARPARRGGRAERPSRIS